LKQIKCYKIQYKGSGSFETCEVIFDVNDKKPHREDEVIAYLKFLRKEQNAENIRVFVETIEEIMKL
jgi:hypothetical protein